MEWVICAVWFCVGGLAGASVVAWVARRREGVLKAALVRVEVDRGRLREEWRRELGKSGVVRALLERKAKGDA